MSTTSIHTLQVRDDYTAEVGQLVRNEGWVDPTYDDYSLLPFLPQLRTENQRSSQPLLDNPHPYLLHNPTRNNRARLNHPMDPLLNSMMCSWWQLMQKTKSSRTWRGRGDVAGELDNCHETETPRTKLAPLAKGIRAAHLRTCLRVEATEEGSASMEKNGMARKVQTPMTPRGNKHIQKARKRSARVSQPGWDVVQAAIPGTCHALALHSHPSVARFAVSHHRSQGRSEHLPCTASHAVFLGSHWRRGRASLPWVHHLSSNLLHPDETLHQNWHREI